MDTGKNNIYSYRYMFSHKTLGMFGCPKYDTTSRVSSSMTYCRLRSYLRLPVVYAETSAVEVIEKRMGNRSAKPVAMVTADDINAYLSKESGKDRIKQMFARSESGKFSDETYNIGLTMFNACASAFLLSSVFSGMRAKEQFLEENQATVFKSRFRAERLMNDKIILTVLKDGSRWALRIGVFLLPFLMVSQTIAVYRNKSSPLEYVAGSVLSGCLIKMNLGLKACLVGGLVGGVMGLGSGCLIYGLLYSSGELQEERHFRRIQDKLEKEKELQLMFGQTIPEVS